MPGGWCWPQILSISCGFSIWRGDHKFSSKSLKFIVNHGFGMFLRNQITKVGIYLNMIPWFPSSQWIKRGNLGPCGLMSLVGETCKSLVVTEVQELESLESCCPIQSYWCDCPHHATAQEARINVKNCHHSCMMWKHVETSRVYGVVFTSASAASHMKSTPPGNMPMSAVIDPGSAVSDIQCLCVCVCLLLGRIWATYYCSMQWMINQHNEKMILCLH